MPGPPARTLLPGHGSTICLHDPEPETETETEHRPSPRLPCLVLGAWPRCLAKVPGHNAWILNRLRHRMHRMHRMHRTTTAVTSFSTASRARLRRAGPDGHGREQPGRDAAVERKRAASMTRRRRPGFTRGLAVAGRQLSPRPSDASPTARRAAAHGAPVTGRRWSPPYSAAAPASTTARPTPTRDARREP